ncbi:MAG: site-specific integrase [Hyphomicrobiales bacterium]|nr:site-specific integrase [Hyphomicrobiales bacterium]
MPRQAKGPRLAIRRRPGRPAVWVIRDEQKIVRARNDTGDVILVGGNESRRAAEKALASYLAEKHIPQFGSGDPASVLITDVLRLYAEGRGPLMQHPEIAGYQLPKLMAFFAGKTVSAITPGLCRRYAESRMREPNSRYKDQEIAPRVSASTVRRELVTLQAALRYAWKEKKLPYPIHVAKPDEAPGRDRWLTRDEAAKLLMAAWRTNRHVARFILIALYTGTRHEAVLKLRWGVNSEGGWVDLEQGILYRRGDGDEQSKKRRTPVPISRRLAAHLKRWRSLSVTHVIEWESQPIAKLRRSWKRACRRAGLDVTPHALRHTFASWAVQRGLPFGQIARALGTTETMVERRYGHHSPEHLRDVVEGVSGPKLDRAKLR